MMDETFAFTRSHNILIDAPAEAILDYVSNPNSWPEWLAASHHIDSPDRPLQTGDTFHEIWHTRSGEARLDWLVTERQDGKIWIGETFTGFTGKIVVKYTTQAKDGLIDYTRTMTNPARPKPPSNTAIERMDQEAEIALANIKRIVEEKQR